MKRGRSNGPGALSSSALKANARSVRRGLFLVEPEWQSCRIHEMIPPRLVTRADKD
jgi:hypothetical protein